MVSTEECWLWAGVTTPWGYGALYTEGKKYRAYRITYEEVKGHIPEGLEIDHLCKVPQCINPEHLEAVTHKVNMQRRFGIDMCKRGHKLTEDNVYVGVKHTNGRIGRQCKKCVLRRKGGSNE